VSRTCTRCGDTTASFCEDWDCHKGWTDPLDDDYLLEHAREQQRRAANHNTAGGDRCARCPHGWHGATCATAACGCATSWKASA